MDPAPQTLGDLISELYEEFLGLYGDEDLAAAETARVVNGILDARDLDQEFEPGDVTVSLSHKA